MSEQKSEIKVKDIWDTLTTSNACSEAMTWLGSRKECTLLEWGKQYLEDSKADPSWGIWYLNLYGEKVDAKVRQLFIQKIIDPMQAFSIYLDCEWLTAEEDKLLEEKFKGKLPRAEQELRDGIVRRKKTEAERG